MQKLTLANSRQHQTLIEQWKGSKWSTWSIVSTPAFGNPESLNSACCTSTSFCVASGYNYDDGSAGGQALIDQRNGSNWSIVTTPFKAPKPPSWA
jgi:hypothetical protein